MASINARIAALAEAVERERLMHTEGPGIWREN